MIFIHFGLKFGPGNGFKAYLLKSGYSEKEIDKQFLKITKFKRSTALDRKKKEKSGKNERTKGRFVTDYEPAVPSIHGVLKTLEPSIKASRLLKKMFPDGAKNVSLRRGGRDIKEILATTKSNYREERGRRTGNCGPCGKPCTLC